MSRQQNLLNFIDYLWNNMESLKIASNKKDCLKFSDCVEAMTQDEDMILIANVVQENILLNFNSKQELINSVMSDVRLTNYLFEELI